MYWIGYLNKEIVVTKLAYRLSGLHDKNNNEDMFTKSVFPKVFSEKTAKCYKESATSYKKLFENKEFYDAIMNSLGNVIYRLMKNEYNEDSKEQDNKLKVAEDSEEYKLEE